MHFLYGLIWFYFSMYSFVLLCHQRISYRDLIYLPILYWRLTRLFRYNTTCSISLIANILFCFIFGFFIVETIRAWTMACRRIIAHLYRADVNQMLSTLSHIQVKHRSFIHSSVRCLFLLRWFVLNISIVSGWMAIQRIVTLLQIPMKTKATIAKHCYFHVCALPNLDSGTIRHHLHW